MKQTKNSVFILIENSLKLECKRFHDDKNNYVTFYYDCSKFCSDEFLNIKQFIEVYNGYQETLYSKLITRILYLEHNDIIEQWFDN